jgi:hypothetical protein
MKKTIILSAVLLTILFSACKKSSNPTPYYPTAGLVSYYSFDRSFYDQLGFDDTASFVTASFAPGKVGQAMSLNGTYQYALYYFKGTFINGGNSVSVSFWFNSAATPGLKYFIMCNDFGIWTDNDQVGMAISTPSTNSASGSFTTNIWTHFVGTYDGNNIKVYLNGVLAGTTVWAGTPSGTAGNFTIGSFNSVYWAGSIDELFIYKKALSQSEVTTLYTMKK